MKTATVTEAGPDFPRVLKWVEAGEEVQAVKEGKTAPPRVPIPPPATSME